MADFQELAVEEEMPRVSKSAAFQAGRVDDASRDDTKGGAHEMSLAALTTEFAPSGGVAVTGMQRLDMAAGAREGIRRMSMSCGSRCRRGMGIGAKRKFWSSRTAHWTRSSMSCPCWYRWGPAPSIHLTSALGASFVELATETWRQDEIGRSVEPGGKGCVAED